MEDVQRSESDGGNRWPRWSKSNLRSSSFWGQLLAALGVGSAMLTRPHLAAEAGCACRIGADGQLHRMIICARHHMPTSSALGANPERITEWQVVLTGTVETL